MDIPPKRRQGKMQSISYRLLLAAALLGTATACSPTVDMRGNQPLPEHLAEIKPGRYTKSDVVALIGTPATVGPFSDDHWYYISSKFETFAFLKPEEIERQVVVIDFDKSGTVTNLRKLSLADGESVDMAAGETPTAGKELSVLEQLLGNVGKFNSSSNDAPKGP